MTLVRYNPYRPFPMMRRFGTMFDRMFNDFGHTSEDDDVVWSPRIEVTENENRFEVSAELPGMDAKDIQVDVRNNILTLSGEKKSEKEEKDRQRVICERVYGAFNRSFHLPTLVDSDNIKARFKNGVLTLELPKVEEAKPKQIQVDVN